MVVAVVLMLAVALVSATQIKMELMPAGDEGTIAVSVTTRPGIRLAEKETILAQVEEVITACGDVEHYTLMDSSYIVDDNGLRFPRIYGLGATLNDQTSSWNLKNTIGLSLREGFQDWVKFGLTAFVRLEKRRFKLEPRIEGLDYGEYGRGFFGQGDRSRRII